MWLVKNGKSEWERYFGSVIVALVVGFALNDSISNGFVDRASLNMLYWPIMAAGYSLKEILIEEDKTLNEEEIQAETSTETILEVVPRTHL